jgi:hypothetical protein
MSSLRCGGSLFCCRTPSWPHNGVTDSGAMGSRFPANILAPRRIRKEALIDGCSLKNPHLMQPPFWRAPAWDEELSNWRPRRASFRREIQRIPSSIFKRAGQDHGCSKAGKEATITLLLGDFVGEERAGGGAWAAIVYGHRPYRLHRAQDTREEMIRVMHEEHDFSDLF